jgi:hypothetical protein
MEQELYRKELAEERAKKLMAEARLRSLESRIHPHFLFNTTTVQISRERDRGLLKTRIVSRLDGHLARAGYRVAEPTVLSKLDGRA